MLILSSLGLSLLVLVVGSLYSCLFRLVLNLFELSKLRPLLTSFAFCSHVWAASSSHSPLPFVWGSQGQACLWSRKPLLLPCWWSSSQPSSSRFFLNFLSFKQFKSSLIINNVRGSSWVQACHGCSWPRFPCSRLLNCPLPSVSLNRARSLPQKRTGALKASPSCWSSAYTYLLHLRTYSLKIKQCSGYLPHGSHLPHIAPIKAIQSREAA